MNAASMRNIANNYIQTQYGKKVLDALLTDILICAERGEFGMRCDMEHYTKFDDLNNNSCTYLQMYVKTKLRELGYALCDPTRQIEYTYISWK